MTVSSVKYRGNQGSNIANTNRGPSPNIWSQIPIGNILDGSNDGWGHRDDFLIAYDGSPTSVANIGFYEMFAESGGSFLGGVTKYGIQGLVAGTTADADVIMTLGGGAPFEINTSGVGKLVFEARIKISSIADNIGSFFIGLAEEDRAAAAGLLTATQGTTADSALADIDMLGFWHPDTDAALLHVAYGKAGQTAVKLIDSFHTMVADTWFKVGFVFDLNQGYDGTILKTPRIKFYLNGVESSTVLDSSSTAATGIAATDFPAGEEMTMVCGIVNDDATNDHTLSVDWWQCFQLEL